MPDLSSLAMRGLKTIMEGEKRGYGNLTKALIDQLFAKPQTEIRYDCVLDLKDIFNIDKYRINQLY
jgi:hypothetical protein